MKLSPLHASFFGKQIKNRHSAFHVLYIKSLTVVLSGVVPIERRRDSVSQSCQQKFFSVTFDIHYHRCMKPRVYGPRGVPRDCNKAPKVDRVRKGCRLSCSTPFLEEIKRPATRQTTNICEKSPPRGTATLFPPETTLPWKAAVWFGRFLVDSGEDLVFEDFFT